MVSKLIIVGIKVRPEDLQFLKEIAVKVGLPVSSFMRSASLQVAREKQREVKNDTD